MTRATQIRWTEKYGGAHPIEVCTVDGTLCFEPVASRIDEFADGHVEHSMWTTLVVDQPIKARLCDGTNCSPWSNVVEGSNLTSVPFAVPEPSYTAMSAAALITIGLLHRWRRR